MGPRFRTITRRSQQIEYLHRVDFRKLEKTAKSAERGREPSDTEIAVVVSLVVLVGIDPKYMIYDI